MMQKHELETMAGLNKDTNHTRLIETIGNNYQAAKNEIITAVNTQMLHAYWRIGKDIVEFEQGGSVKADTSKLIVSKYQLYLPEIQQLKNRVLEIIEK